MLPFFLTLAMKEKLIEHLAQFVTDRRLQLFNTRAVTTYPLYHRGARGYLISPIMPAPCFAPANASAYRMSTSSKTGMTYQDQSRCGPGIQQMAHPVSDITSEQNNTRDAIEALEKQGIPHRGHHTRIKMIAPWRILTCTKAKSPCFSVSELKGLSPTATGTGR